MTRKTFEQFRRKALKKPGVKAEYDALAPAFEKQLRAITNRAADWQTTTLGSRKDSGSAPTFSLFRLCKQFRSAEHFPGGLSWQRRGKVRLRDDCI